MGRRVTLHGSSDTVSWQNSAANRHRRAMKQEQFKASQPSDTTTSKSRELKDHPSKCKRIKRDDGCDRPAAYASPDEPDSPSLTPSAKRVMKKKSGPTDQPKPGPSRSTDPSTEACIRKLTRPQKPGCRSQVKRLNNIYPLPKKPAPVAFATETTDPDAEGVSKDCQSTGPPETRHHHRRRSTAIHA